MRIQLELYTNSGLNINLKSNVDAKNVEHLAFCWHYMEDRLILYKNDFHQLKSAATRYLKTYENKPDEVDENLFKVALEVNIMEFKNPFFMSASMLDLIINQELPFQK